MIPRIAHLSDLDGIKECIDKAFVLYIERMKKKPGPMVTDYAPHIKNNRVYVSCRDNIIQGVLLLIPHQDYLFLDTIAVHPSQQGKGIGRYLIKFAEDHSIQTGFSELRLCTNVHMYENHRFYTDLGFLEIFRCNVSGYDRIYYRKYLSTEPRHSL